MTQKKGQITAQQTKAIEVLLTSRSIQQASETCGLAYKTLRRWMGDPTFKAALIKRESETLDAATRRLAGLGNDAIDTMAKIMTSGENETNKLRAAQSILDNLLRLRELRDVEERLSALEEKVNDNQNTFIKN